MKWLVRHGDILTQPADVLICPANVFLNLSGGVGGEILLRLGDAMQRELHRYLLDRKRRHVERGDVIATSSGGTPFKHVLHAVAVDGFYQTSPAVIEALVRKSLIMAAQLEASSVALAALGTGFGRLTMRQFAEGVAPLRAVEFRPLAHIVITVQKESQATELLELLPHAAIFSA